MIDGMPPGHVVVVPEKDDRRTRKETAIKILSFLRHEVCLIPGHGPCPWLMGVDASSGSSITRPRRAHCHEVGSHGNFPRVHPRSQLRRRPWVAQQAPDIIVHAKHHGQFVHGSCNEVFRSGRPGMAFELIRMTACIEVETIGITLTNRLDLRIQHGKTRFQILSNTDELHIVVIGGHGKAAGCRQLASGSKQNILKGQKIIFSMGIGQPKSTVGMTLAHHVGHTPGITRNLHLVA